jgi:hypothetical protein
MHFRSPSDAADMIGKLNLQYNRARQVRPPSPRSNNPPSPVSLTYSIFENPQGKITGELIEIITVSFTSPSYPAQTPC